MDAIVEEFIDSNLAIDDQSGCLILIIKTFMSRSCLATSGLNYH